MTDAEIAEIAEAIARRRDISIEDAQRIVAAAEPLWRALEVPGFVDAFGGAEFDRIFPEVVDFIHRLANPLAHEVTA
jgi:hypothetical protein